MRRKDPRAISLEILKRIEETDRHPDDLLSDSFKRYRHLTSLDRAFLTELTYGVLRWRGRIDWIIRHFSNLPFEKIEPDMLNTLRLGLYQIFFLTRTPASAAVNESVELAKRTRGRKGGGFVNGILRSALRGKEAIPYPDRDRDPALHLAVIQSHPLWLVRRWIEELGFEETLKICAANNRTAPLTLRTNTLKVRREALIEKLKEKGLNAIPTSFSDEGVLVRDAPPISELPFLNQGLFAIQDEASQLITLLLDPKPGEKILDACAAPGGKTTHIAQRMQNVGEIDALDLRREKLRQIEEGCRRLGIKIVRPKIGNAINPLPVPEETKFDRVLADVPCSGFGTLRRNPDVKWKKDREDIERLHQLQFSILKNLSGYVREGGLLVYSTCTVFHEENEDVVERFLSEDRAFHLDSLMEALPETCRVFAKRGYFKTFPPADEMDGFFAARLRRGS
ncbi:MAG: 16S rRNA (cytosine(967)-C(5))-methyltransferase RsmB [Thermodesulfobacteriota bacterium]